MGSASHLSPCCPHRPQAMGGEPHIHQQPHGTRRCQAPAGFRDAPAVPEGSGVGQTPKSRAIPWGTDCFSLFRTEKAGLMQKTNYFSW